MIRLVSPARVDLLVRFGRIREPTLSKDPGSSSRGRGCYTRLTRAVDLEDGMIKPRVTTPCAFVRPGRTIARNRTDHDLQSRMVDSTLWTLDREATSRGIAVEEGVYKLSLPPEVIASVTDPPAHTGLPERYKLVYFEPGILAVYMLEPRRNNESPL